MTQGELREDNNISCKNESVLKKTTDNDSDKKNKGIEVENEKPNIVDIKAVDGEDDEKNSTLLRRRRQNNSSSPSSNNNNEHINNNDNNHINNIFVLFSLIMHNPWNLRNIKIKLLLSILIVLLIYGSGYYVYFVKNYRPTESTSDSFVDWANIIQGTGTMFEEMIQHRIILLDLADTLNDAYISEILLHLTKNIETAEEGIVDLCYIASKSFKKMQIEVSLIKRALSEIEKGHFNAHTFAFRYKTEYGKYQYTQKLLEIRFQMLNSIITSFRENLHRVILYLDQTEHTAQKMREHLIDGERKARNEIKNHRFNALKDYNDRIRAQKELLQILFAINSLRTNLIKVDAYCNRFKLNSKPKPNLLRVYQILETYQRELLLAPFLDDNWKLYF
ncbi:7297_t:CDS:2 [Ambispora leptoticha]|uniref:7297_t:CDS:1 n=1 Tax=Ambispora leptoticha TaxID=144679 RepID=A0A9N9BPK1_9GLOM|nr:7297_t:CDS:2 [Ambispora leptoticha]